MSHHTNKRLVEYVTGPTLALSEFTRLAILVAEMVHREHQQIAIIGYLNPANIVIAAGGLSAWLTESVQWHEAYRAPEQSGRMNRIPDERCDLYALGVIYYELLAGQLPFQPGQDEDWETVHIQQAPLPLAQLRVDTEGPLEAMMMKLLSKSPEDRYQSAYGLLDDLQQCDSMLTESGRIAPFEVGSLDHLRQFRVPDTLFGRSEAMKQLEDGIQQAASGGLAFRWVTGEEGVGKTALVHQLRLTAARWGGRFVEGTAVQAEHASPYRPLLQALGEWLEQLWSEPPRHIALLRERLQAEFGEEAQIIASLLPGAQPMFAGQAPGERTAPSVDNGKDTGPLLTRLIGFFAANSPPLVLFLDHMERAKASLCSVLETLAQSHAAAGLLVIGACRTSGEQGAELEDVLEAAWLNERLRTFPSEQITLQPLGYDEVRNYLECGLHGSSLRIRLLTRAVFN
ncbi:ATP-binding protein [Paenibacillus eucommiae]|uniref:Protein kinase domain-containing protein n=1 Tax=Paenibacillus eucommiae TaxID=1355755 RepID=A0ABS4J364_9BACL|nr:AAA family ATPase [Paenibacillus eucommiae]MBP1994243.1 hypothetical protein [Paenibacillus eucommiae]